MLPIYKAKNPDATGFFVSDVTIYIIVMIVSLFSGCFTGPMWISVVEEISSYASERNLGLFLSYFWGFVTMGTLSGNFVGYVIFMNEYLYGFFLMMGSLCILSGLFFTFLKSNVKPNEESEQY